MEETRPAEIVVYGAYWCPDCRRSKQFLGEHQIAYHWVDIEQDQAAEQLVMEKNGGKRIIPTIVFADGSILVEPSNAQLAAKLGLKTTAMLHHYDLIVVGGGPAGLTAALYSEREGLNTLVIERGAFGGQAAITERLENFPGFADGIEGGVFAAQLRRQAERFGVELLQAQDVIHVRTRDNYHLVQTSDGSEYSCQALLLAVGSRYKRLDVPGENDFIGAGIHFCATCDGPFYKGEEVAVVGGGNSASEESLALVKYAKKVTLLVRKSSLSATQIIQDKVLTHPQVEVRFNTQVVRFSGARGKLKDVELKNAQTGVTEIIHPKGVFIFIGLTPNTEFVEDAGILRNPWGFILTGHDLMHGKHELPGFIHREPMMLETSIPGIFAAGDAREGSTKQLAAAAGEGAAAALMIRNYLKTV